MHQQSTQAWHPTNCVRTLDHTERRGVCHISDVLPFVLARMEVAAARTRRGHSGRSSTRNTASDRGPWAPITSDCSMSAVLEGPEIKQPNSGCANESRA